MYTTDEKVWWIQQLYAGNSLRRVSDLFTEHFPNQPKPDASTIKWCNDQFKATRNVSEVKMGPRPHDTLLTDEAILAAVEAYPSASSRTIGEMVGRSHGQVIRRLHKYGFHSYKIHEHQELRPGDATRHYEFAQTALEMIEGDPDLIRHTLFTDEASFTLHHATNHQNCRRWAKENPHVVHTSSTQYLQSVNVWAGILDRHIIGPLFIDGTLTGEKYLEMLQGPISERLQELECDYPIYYQQDGCPAHNYGPAKEFLRNVFPGR